MNWFHCSVLVAVLLFFVALPSKGQTPTTLICQTCNWPADGVSCYEGNLTNTVACALTEQLVPYCQTAITLEDGIVTAISRSCVAAQTDQDSSTDTMPTEPSCVSSPGGGTVTQDTTCYYACGANNCNSVKPSNLKFCANSCLFGTCNYITGECACQTGYTGATCNTGAAPGPQNFRSCVQCSEETDNTCRTQTAASGSPCDSPNSDYCATSTTTTYDSNGNNMRSIVTRSCTDTFVSADECFISSTEDSTYTNEVEYTCITTCDKDNCNTGIPDGLISSNEALQPRFCLQCSDTSDGSSCASGSLSPSVCPSGQSYCTSTSQYYFSERNDKSTAVEPDYRLISITRGCTNTEVSSTCSEQSLPGSSLKIVTCRETCISDGCNFRWPARPLCSQCPSSLNCAAQPSQPEACPFPYQRYCTAIDTNRPRDTSKFNQAQLYGYTRTVARQCAYNSIGNTCVQNSYGDGSTENCNKTCSTDGCNLGNTATIETFSSFLISTMVLVTAAIFA